MEYMHLNNVIIHRKTSKRVEVCYFLLFSDFFTVLTCICREYGFIPANVLDTSSTGMQTREGSRTLEVTT